MEELTGWEKLAYDNFCSACEVLKDEFRKKTIHSPEYVFARDIVVMSMEYFEAKHNGWIQENNEH